MEAIVGAGLPAKVAAVISNRADAAGLKFAALSALPLRWSMSASFPRAGRSTPRSRRRSSGIRPTSSRSQASCVSSGAISCGTTRAGWSTSTRPLLPAFPGLHTHRRALQEGVKLHGCTVHFVTPQVDHGPIIVQAAVPVRAGDTEATLAARVLRQEHRVYPLAIRWFVEGRLAVETVSCVSTRPTPFKLCWPTNDPASLRHAGIAALALWTGAAQASRRNASLLSTS